MDTHHDRPRDEILALAEHVLQLYESKGHKAEVKFKFTCAHCGERCTLVESNMLRESGECFKCGKITPLEKAGFMLVLAMKEDVKANGESSK